MSDPAPPSDLVERVARAMAESAGFAWEACAQDQWRRDAQAAIAALPAAGAAAPPSPELSEVIRVAMACTQMCGAVEACLQPPCACAERIAQVVIAALPAAGAAMELREALERLMNADAAGVPNNEWEGAKKQARAALASAPARPSPPSPQETPA